MGTSFGVGVTHLCLLLGTYFSQTRNKIALIEWRDQHTFSALEEAYEGKMSAEDEPFNIKKVVYYKHFNQPNLSSLKDGTYEVLVIDFGEVNEKFFSIYNDLDIKLVVGHSNEWKYKEIEAVINRFERQLSLQWKFVLPFASRDELKFLSRCVKAKLFPMSFYKDPFRYDQNLVKEIENVLNL